MRSKRSSKSGAGVVELDGSQSIQWEKIYFFPPGVFASRHIARKVLVLTPHPNFQSPSMNPEHVHYAEVRCATEWGLVSEPTPLTGIMELRD